MTYAEKLARQLANLVCSKYNQEKMMK